MDAISRYLNLYYFLFSAKFLTRPEIVAKYLPEFLDWSLQIITKESKDMSDDICKMGALKSVAAIYKHGKREDLLKYAPTVQKIVQDSKLDKHENVVIQKLGVKLMQRLGLTFLKVHKKIQNILKIKKLGFWVVFFLIILVRNMNNFGLNGLYSDDSILLI